MYPPELIESITNIRVLYQEGLLDYTGALLLMKQILKQEAPQLDFLPAYPRKVSPEMTDFFYKEPEDLELLEKLQSEMNAPDIIQLERKGSTYIMSTAHSDEVFSDTKLSGIDLGDEVYIGLFVCSHNNAVKEKAIFRNVRIIIPAEGNVK